MKYVFEMTLDLQTRPLGRWNKMVIHSYDSVNTGSGIITPVALKHERPFWFSKVRSYVQKIREGGLVDLGKHVYIWNCSNVNGKQLVYSVWNCSRISTSPVERRLFYTGIRTSICSTASKPGKKFIARFNRLHKQRIEEGNQHRVPARIQHFLLVYFA